MKKSILMLGLAVAAMTSCTNDEVVEVNQSTQKAIGFETFVNKGTRVAVTNEVTAGNLQRFYVYGYNDKPDTVFNNVSVVKSGDVWSMQSNNERDWETQSYNFAAYADGVGDTSHVASTLTTSFTNATLTFTDYTVNSDQAQQTDLIAAVTARNNTNTLDVTKVGLDFKHLLSKVDFKFSNTNKNSLSMVVSDVTLKVKTKASCAYSSSSTTWSGWDTETTYTLAQPSNGNDENVFGGENALKDTQKKFIIEKDSVSSVSAEYFVIPDQTEASINYTVVFYDADGNEVERKENQSLSLFTDSNRESVTWEPSYIYKYNVQLPASPKKIEFTVNTVGGWTSTEVSLDGSANN